MFHGNKGRAVRRAVSLRTAPGALPGAFSFFSVGRSSFKAHEIMPIICEDDMKSKRLYALFIVGKNALGLKKYVRWTFSDGSLAPAFSKTSAVIFYQDMLMASAMGQYPMRLELRPVKAIEQQ
jgi:hypothetical protein